MSQLITFREAIRQALFEEMARDDRVFMMGEDIGLFGGARGVTKGLLDRFGEERVRDTPLSETAIIGGGVGAAMSGLRPVCELMLMGFISVCFDEIHNLAGKWTFRFSSSDPLKIPLVIRGPFGIENFGVEPHSQSPEALFIHSPGIKIAIPSTPHDAKGLLKTAIRDDGPVLFFEHSHLYDYQGPVPVDEYTVLFGQADIRREGRDVTLIAHSLMLHRVLDAAALLEQKHIEAEVIDLRTLVPLDKETIFRSIRNTGRVVIIQESYKRGGYASEIAAVISEEIFHELKAPIVRIGAPNLPIPYSPDLIKLYRPDAATIASVVEKVIHGQAF
ncbi:MAG: alpha-ketoacid dehydrogenase subunit beta [Deltaproteobacteria bacterium]|nr:alpha-ketoacid dehydrogenase subunit beta [Deltaproteobacteria bacterium]